MHSIKLCNYFARGISRGVSRTVAILFAVILISSASHASKGVNTAVNITPDNDTLVVAWPKNVGTLNPHMYVPNEMFAQVLSYDSLVRYDGGKVESSLAKSWKISDDGMSYIFYLHEDIKFSDGSDFNAKVVAMNFDAIMANAARHRWLGIIDIIDGWQTNGEYEFELKLKQPYNIALEELSLPRPFRMLAPSGFLDDEINTSKGIKKPIGTGPWVIVDTKLGEYDIFKRNEYYWGGMPTFSSLVVKVLPDPSSRVLALETGAVDILIGEGSFTLENYVRLSKDPKYVVEKSSPRITHVVAINSNRGFTKDARVRLAMQYAINKEALVEGVLLGLEEVAYTFFRPELENCDVGLTPYEYDVDKANKILDEAGWKRKGAYRQLNKQTLDIDLHYIGTDPTDKALAEVIQADLLKIGVKVNLRAEEQTIFYNLQANGSFDMIFNKTWGPPFDPGSFLASMRTPSHADYQAQLGLESKGEIDDAITNVLTGTNKQVIADNYRYLLTELHESGVYITVSYGLDLVIYRKSRVDGFKFGEMSTEFLFHQLNIK